MGDADFLLAFHHHHHHHSTTHHSSHNSGIRVSRQMMLNNVAIMNRRRSHPSDSTVYTQSQPSDCVNAQNFKDTVLDACLILIVMLLIFMIGYTIYHWVKKD